MSDIETACGVAKKIRFRIGRKFGLPKMGLTNREYAAHKSWERKTEEEKIKIKTKLAENGFGKQN